MKMSLPDYWMGARGRDCLFRISGHYAGDVAFTAPPGMRLARLAGVNIELSLSEPVPERTE
ncbi:MAG: hypothetical protein K2Q10_10100 [Rhodospirillales bacterium]|nr:hypothetical protein [Rhodospirillales bacterium]